MQRKLLYKDTVIPKVGQHKGQVGLVTTRLNNKTPREDISVLFTTFDARKEDTELERFRYKEDDLILYEPNNYLIRPLVPGDFIYVRDELDAWFTPEEVYFAGSKQIFDCYDEDLSLDNQPVYLVESESISLIAANIDISRTNKSLMPKNMKMQQSPTLPQI